MKKGYTLVVEDDRDELDTILSALAHREIPGEVVVVESGGEALQTLFGKDGPSLRGLGLPRLVVLDADAPRVRALDLPLLVRMHPRTARLPIVTLVSSPDDVCRARDGRLVADWFVRKPCGVLALGAAVEAAQARRAPERVPVHGHA
jgi:DNA-binding response OmpR family regulator